MCSRLVVMTMGNKNNKKGGLLRLGPQVEAILIDVGFQWDIESKAHKKYVEARRKWAYKEVLKINSTNVAITKKKIGDHHVRRITSSLTKTMTNGWKHTKGEPFLFKKGDI
jgi:hypothetical protein